MNTRHHTATACRLTALLAAGLALGAASLRAQTAAITPADTTAPAKEPEVLVLSPFTVSSARDTGYQATDSLAGTRLRTPLRDIAASISVVTKDFLEDTGATNMNRLLVYTTGTEVSGIGGNYSASNTAAGTNQDFDSQRRVTNGATRLRGLASADTTRNYFGTGILLDAYNTESVTINRGSNSILFGLGSPAGIIENTTIAPRFRNEGKAEFRLDSNGSTRQSLDLERVLIDQKLSVRVAALNDEGAFEQKPAYRDQERYFGALEFRPFRQTTIRVNAETGQLNQSLPRIDPPMDALTAWFAYGKPERLNNLYPGPPFTSPANPVIANDVARNLNGPYGTFFYHPGVFFGDDSGAYTDAFPSFADTPTLQYRYLAPANSLVVETLAGSVLSPFKVPNQITDRSIFDYRKRKIDGLNDGTFADFDAVNVAVEQLFLDGNAGIEVVYDKQKVATDTLEVNQQPRGNEIRIDPNRQTVDGRPNPNFGRPFISSIGQANRVINRDESYRATAFYKFDFAKRINNWAGRLLGSQTLTGFYTDSTTKNYTVNGANALIAPSFVSGANTNGIGDRRVAAIYYLGPSLAGMSSPAGANLHGVDSKLTIPDSVNIWVLNNATGNTWVKQTHQIYQYPDFTGIATSVTGARNDVESHGGVWQANLWDGTLVPTLGWRRDKVANFNGNNNAASGLNAATGTRLLTEPTLTQSLGIDSELFSQGYVLRLPKAWRDRLPAGTDVSLYYNQSENFQVTGFRQNFLGEALAPQSGTTKEIGFGFTTLGGKLTFRAARYETDQLNVTDSRVTNIPGQIASIEQRIANDNSPAALAAVGYVAFDDASASALYKQFAQIFNLRVDSVRANGTRNLLFTAPVGGALATSTTSKGLEFEAVYNPLPNWRIAFNAARQEATRGATDPVLDALMEDRMKFWTNPAIAPLVASSGWTVGTFAAASIINPYNLGRLSTGLPASELREWRANVITHYTFTRDSRLKGWSIGGAARWQDEIVIGFPVYRDTVLGLVQDVKRPFMGPDEFKFDTWLSYERKLGDKVNWKLQLNIRNILDSDLLIPVRANPVAVDDYKNYTIGAYRIGEARTFELTSTFTF